MRQAVVIGAGPYGLSIGAHLKARQVAVRVFGDPMASWREHMPAGMLLKSAPVASSLSTPLPGFTFSDYCRSIGHRMLTQTDAIPVELFVRYGSWFQERLVPDIERDMVTRVTQTARGFELTLSSGKALHAMVVVVASGHVPFAYVPAEFSRAVPAGPSAMAAVSHASQHASFAGYAGRRVAVVGSGQSALESAVLLYESGAEVQLIARANHLLWAGTPRPSDRAWPRRLVKPPSDLGPGWSHRVLTDAPWLVRLLPPHARVALMRKVLGPSGAFWLRDRFEGKFEVRLGRAVRDAEPLPSGGVRLDLKSPNGAAERIEVDHVVAGTGYRIDLDGMDFLDPEIRSSLRRVANMPWLSASSETSLPGLYLTGVASAPTFGPYMRFVAGTRFAAPLISRAVASAIAG